jgi:UDP-glucose 4-epimerase
MMKNKPIKIKTLVLGGAGYIGSHLVSAINSIGEQVAIIDDLSAGHIEACKDNNFYLGDYSDINVLDKVFREFEIDNVFIFAAKASVSDSIENPSLYYLNNVSKLIQFMEYTKSTNIKNIVFSSSASVYGIPEYTPIDEEHPKNPISPYGNSKLMGETIVADCCKAQNINFALIRYFNAAGSNWKEGLGESHLPENHLIPKSIQKAMNNEKMVVYGTDFNTTDGSAVRDFIHVNDLSSIHLESLRYISVNNKSLIINAGSGEGYSVNKVLRSISKLTGSTDITTTGRRQGDPDILVADISKASKLLKWNPIYNLEQILSDAFNWEKTRKY